MESKTEYLERKREEVVYLNSLLDCPIGLPDIAEAGDVVDVKLLLRRRQMAEALRCYPELSDTHLDVWHSPYYDYALEYYYQRFDLRVTGPGLYAAFDDPAVAGGHVIAQRYVASGMSALAAVLLGLDHIVANRWSVVCFADTFFETQHLIAKKAHALELNVVRTSAECLNVLAANMRREHGLVLLLDSFMEEDRFAVLLDAPPGAYDLLIVDTTCYPVDSPIVASIMERATVTGIPLVLVRSHLKIDGMGVEYGRLGSIAACSPASADAAHRHLSEELLRSADDLIATIGLAPVVTSIHPHWHRPEYRALNARRLERLRTNNDALLRAIRQVVPGEPPLAHGYHHGLFITLWLASATNHAEARAAASDLARRCRERAVPVRFGTSFGFDFIAVAEFVDTLRNRAVVRIAPADLHGSAMQAFAELLADWCAGSGGATSITGAPTVRPPCAPDIAST